MYHLSSIRQVIVEKFSHLIIAPCCVVDTHIHYKINLQNNQEHIMLMFARDLFPFLPNTSEDHRTKIRAITSWDLVYCRTALHGRINFMLVWFVKRYNLPPRRCILLFIVATIKRPKSISIKGFVVGCTRRTALLSHIMGCVSSNLD